MGLSTRWSFWHGWGTVKRTKNAAGLALKASNSPVIIFQHYRELVTSQRAKGWFGITQAVIRAESKRLKEEGARLRAARAKGGTRLGSTLAKQEVKKAEKRGRRKACVGAVVPVRDGAKIVAFPAKAAA
jgi:hypothetical protein